VKDKPEELRGRNAERNLTALMLAEIREQNALLTEFTARLGSQIVNNVLEVATRTFPNDAYLGMQFSVAAGVIEVSNDSEHDITVSSAAPQSSAPTNGIGVYIVPAGERRVVNVASHNITLYGTAADTVSYQVLTRGGLLS
jgi:hypothetical protein